MTSKQLIGRFLADVPRTFIDATLRSLFASCREADEYVRSEFEPEQAHDVLGNLRRAYVERAILKLAEETDGVAGASQANERCTSYYGRVTAGGIVLTVSWVASRESRGHKAVFRELLAENPQGDLFRATDVRPGEACYALLRYGPPLHDGKVIDRRYPGFAEVVFPTAGSTEYLARIDLFELCADVVKDEMKRYQTAQVEEVRDTKNLKLREAKAEDS